MSQPKPIQATPARAGELARPKTYPSLASAAAAFHTRPDHLRRVLRGDRHTAFGYTWRFA